MHSPEVLENTPLSEKESECGKKIPKYLCKFQTSKKLKVEVSDFVHLFEDVSKLKIPSEITTPF